MGLDCQGADLHLLRQSPQHTVLRASVDGIILALQSDVCRGNRGCHRNSRMTCLAGWYEGMLFRGQELHGALLYPCQRHGPQSRYRGRGRCRPTCFPEAPERTWNFDDYLAMMQACTFERDDGSQVWGGVFSSAGNKPLLLLAGSGPQLELGNRHRRATETASGSCKLGEEEGIAWLQWLQDLYFVHGVIPNPAGLSASRWDYFFQKSLLGGVGPSIGWSQRPGLEVDPDTSGRHRHRARHKVDVRPAPHQPGRPALPLLGWSNAGRKFDQVFNTGDSHRDWPFDRLRPLALQSGRTRPG